MKTVLAFLIFLIIFSFSINISAATNIEVPIKEYTKLKENITQSANPSEPVDLLSNKKIFLSKALSILSASINNQKEVLYNLQSLNQVEKDRLSFILQQAVGELSAQNTRIEASQTEEDLKKITPTVLQIWNNRQAEYKKALAEIYYLKTNNVQLELKSQLNIITEQKTLLSKDKKDVTIIDNEVISSNRLYENITINNNQIDAQIPQIKGETYKNAFIEATALLGNLLTVLPEIKKNIEEADYEISRLSQK